MTIVIFPIVSYLAMKAVDKVTDEALSRAIGMIIKTNQEQLAMLGQIDQKLSALLQGPFNTGMNYMEQAALPHRTASDQQGYLRRALDEFNRALGNETGNLERVAWIRWHIALCHELLREDQDAQYHFEKCSQEAKQALDLMRSTYELEVQKHNKAMERVDPASGWWFPVVLIVTCVALAIYFVSSGISVNPENLWQGVLVIGVIVMVLLGLFVSAGRPKPLDQRISPIMQSLIKSVDQVRTMPGFGSTQQVGA